MNSDLLVQSLPDLTFVFRGLLHLKSCMTGSTLAELLECTVSASLFSVCVLGMHVYSCIYSNSYVNIYKIKQ